MTLRNQDQLSAYLQRGYAVFNDLIPYKVCDTLKASAEGLVQNLEPLMLPQLENICDPHFQWEQYYDKVKQNFCVFLHHQKSKKKGRFQYKGFLVKKLSYALHQVDQIFRDFSFSSFIQQPLSRLRINNPLILQTMFLVKHPKLGAGMMCHQDASYFYTTPQSLIGLWVALDHFTKENGCLYVLPEGHKSSLKFRLIRTKSGLLNYRQLDSSAWPLEELVPIEVKKGSVIALNGMLPHMTLSNCTSETTHAFSMHMISADSQYSKDNWLQPTLNEPFCALKGCTEML